MSDLPKWTVVGMTGPKEKLGNAWPPPWHMRPIYRCDHNEIPVRRWFRRGWMCVRCDRWRKDGDDNRAIGPIPRDVWEPAATTAKARGDNLRDVTVRALREYGKEE